MNELDINVLALVKGEEQYIFLYNEENRVEMLRTLGRYAADPEMNFSWYDAAVLSKKVREIAYHDLVSQIHACNSQAQNNAAAAQQNVAVRPSPAPKRFSFRPEEDII